MLLNILIVSTKFQPGLIHPNSTKYWSDQLYRIYWILVEVNMVKLLCISIRID